MPPRVSRAVTAADVDAAATARLGVLAVPPGAVVTPLARDLARERGVELVPAAGAGAAAPAGAGRREARPGGADSTGAAGPDVEAQVRRIVGDLLAQGTGQPAGGRGPVRHVAAAATRDLPPFPYPGPQPGQDVRARDVITSADGAPMAAGFLTLTRGEFPWTLDYDEIQYVVEGELHVTVPEGRVVGRPGDVLYVPRGTSITFGTPSWARFLYVTFPADWEPGAGTAAAGPG